MSYGVDVRDLFWRSAAYVDRILKGAKASELPVKAPTQFRAGHLRWPRGYTGGARGLMHSPALTPSICGG
jgi:hypothetical protein